uniref:Uncharacterized protein n=1 Tax=Ascaris lumbricoides TaxID=6252 RepID=A0A0M3HJK2_ASCLU
MDLSCVDRLTDGFFCEKKMGFFSVICENSRKLQLFTLSALDNQKNLLVQFRLKYEPNIQFRLIEIHQSLYRSNKKIYQNFLVQMFHLYPTFIKSHIHYVYQVPKRDYPFY